MNCTQCENRMQQLLDDRLDPRTDLTVQCHAKNCRSCQLALAIFACMERPAPGPRSLANAGSRGVAISRSPTGDECPLGNSTTGAQPLRPRWSRRAIFQLVAATAALIVFGFMVSWQSPTVPMLARSGSVGQPAPPLLAAAQPAEGTPDSPRISDWLVGSLPGISMADVNFYSLSQTGLVSLLPEDQLRTVRGIPATIEAIQPWYEYSTEIPVLNQWSHGIHYTLGLIRNHLPIVSPNLRQNQPKRGSDLGWQTETDRRFLC